MRVTADNFYAVYTGTSSAATTLHFFGAWPQVIAPVSITPAAGNDFVYVVAWDDGRVFQGLLATVAVGAGFAPTGSPLWTVCATNRSLASNAAASPTPAVLTQAIGVCNNESSWHATSNGPNNDNAAAAGFWGSVAPIEGVANWIWDTNGSAACTGPRGFLGGPCNPGEFLIFRLPLASVATCLPPVPDFTIDWTAGYGMLVADATNSQNEQSHFWSVQESDQWWNAKGPEVSQWFVGQQAGIFDLKTFFEQSGQQLKCDTYYRVKLAVSNQCVNWRDTIRLVKLNCCPGDISSLPLAPTPVVSTCLGECGAPAPAQVLVTNSEVGGCPGPNCNLQITILDGELCPNESVKIDLSDGSAWSWTKTYTLTSDPSVMGAVLPGFVETLPGQVVAPGDLLTVSAQIVPNASGVGCKREGNFRFEVSLLH